MPSIKLQGFFRDHDGIFTRQEKKLPKNLRKYDSLKNPVQFSISDLKAKPKLDYDIHLLVSPVSITAASISKHVSGKSADAETAPKSSRSRTSSTLVSPAGPVIVASTVPAIVPATAAKPPATARGAARVVAIGTAVKWKEN